MLGQHRIHYVYWSTGTGLCIHKHSFSEISTGPADAVTGWLCQDFQQSLAGQGDLGTARGRIQDHHGFLDQDLITVSVEHTEHKSATGDVDGFFLLIDELKQQHIVNSLVYGQAFGVHRIVPIGKSFARTCVDQQYLRDLLVDIGLGRVHTEYLACKVLRIKTVW